MLVQNREVSNLFYGSCTDDMFAERLVDICSRRMLFSTKRTILTT